MAQTKRWNLQNNAGYNHQAIIDASERLKQGSTIAFPTETVYGLGADATSETAVARIFEAKGRPVDNPLIAHVATKKQLKQLVQTLPPTAEKLIHAFSPGPLTYVLPSNGTCAKNVTAGLSTIAVRIPSHPVAIALLTECDVPLAAPSANISGKPSPTTAEHVWFDLQGKIGGVLDGGPTGVGLESTVIDCTKETPVILRPGGITLEQLQEVVGPVVVDPALASEFISEHPKAPGMKYKHYAPEVPLWLVGGSAADIQLAIDSAHVPLDRIGVMASSETVKQLNAYRIISLGSKQALNDIAASLFDALRSFKEGNIDLIICEAFPEVGIGHAIMNRLKKAATFYLKK